MHQPASLTELANLITRLSDVGLLAGGTVIVPIWTQQGQPSAIVDVTRVAQLRATLSHGCGAATTLAELEERTDAPTALREAAGSVGGPAVRNAATVGGNIASPGPRCVATALLAVGAQVKTLSPGPPSVVHRQGVADVLRGSGDVVVDVTWSPRVVFSAFRKFSIRPGGGPHLASLSVGWGGPDATSLLAVAVGSLDDRPRRLPRTEAAWSGGAWTIKERVAAACSAVKGEIAQSGLRAADSYRSHLVGVLLAQILRELVERADGCR